MATITEAQVRARLVVTREDGQVRIRAEGESLTAGGERVRTAHRDITGALSAGRLAGAADLLSDVEARLRAEWEIA